MKTQDSIFMLTKAQLLNMLQLVQDNALESNEKSSKILIKDLESFIDEELFLDENTQNVLTKNKNIIELKAEFEQSNNIRKELLSAFPRSFFNHNDEFIADLKSNTYFAFNSCKTPLDVKCKVIEWISRATFKTESYRQEKKNQEFHEKMLNGVNNFLDTNFTMEDMDIIYTKLGNSINHKLTQEFVESKYDIFILTKEKEVEMEYDI